MKRRFIVQTFVLSLAFSLAVSLRVVADELNVPDDYTTIQEAIEAAVDGDVIQVESDTYYENLDLLGKAITLESTDGPDDTTIYGGTLTLGEDYGSVIYVDGVDGDGATIRGFTITEGTGKELGPWGGRRGGGIFALESVLHVENCIIEDNEAAFMAGGGVFAYQGALTLKDCEIRDNDGGGITIGDQSLSRTTSLSMVGCEISDNDETGVALYSADAVLVDCVIRNNCGLLAGGLFAAEADEPLVISKTVFEQNDGWFGGLIAESQDVEISDCRFLGNSGVYGGACAFSGGFLSVTKSLIDSNSASVNGAGINCRYWRDTETSVAVSKTTFVRNDAPFGAALFVSGETRGSDGDIVVKDCIIWDNGDDAIDKLYEEFEISVSYSCVEDGYDGQGNIDDDPLFVDADAGDFRLQEDSPCIDTGDPDSNADLDGSTADMGAFPRYGPQFLRGDVDQNGGVSALQDARFLLMWAFGRGDGPICLDAADIDDNGRVNALSDRAATSSCTSLPRVRALLHPAWRRADLMRPMTTSSVRTRRGVSD